MKRGCYVLLHTWKHSYSGCDRTCLRMRYKGSMVSQHPKIVTSMTKRRTRIPSIQNIITFCEWKSNETFWVNCTRLLNTGRKKKRLQAVCYSIREKGGEKITPLQRREFASEECTLPRLSNLWMRKSAVNAKVMTDVDICSFMVKVVLQILNSSWRVVTECQ